MTPTSSRRPSSSPTEKPLAGVRTKVLAALAAGSIASFLVAGAASAADAPAGTIDAGKLWTKNCQSCHGPDGKGKTKAGAKAKVKDLTSAEVKGKLDRAKAIEAITKGVKEEGSDKLAMKSYSEKLSKEEIEALADHSLSFK
jgi:mono/diheme cytochrome c family protein